MPNTAFDALKNAPRYRISTDKHAWQGYGEGAIVILASFIGISEPNSYVSSDIVTLCKDYALIRIDRRDLVLCQGKYNE